MAMTEMMYQQRTVNGVDVEVFIMGEVRKDGWVARFMVEGVVDGDAIQLGAYRTFAMASDAADVWMTFGGQQS